jgi:hypothetical protein
VGDDGEVADLQGHGGTGPGGGRGGAMDAFALLGKG